MAIDKYALIIGNSDYSHLTSLRTPEADAELYAEILAGRGFKIVGDKVFKNQSITEFPRRIAELVNSDISGDLVVIVYIGHGFSNGRDNYLVPTDAVPRLLEADSLSINEIVQDLIEARAGQIVSVLDACRNDPKLSGRYGDDYGFASVEGLGADFVVTSASAGKVAYDSLSPDDQHANSVFTRVFAEEFRAGGPLQRAVDNAAGEVYRLTSEAGLDPPQIPKHYNDTNRLDFEIFPSQASSTLEPVTTEPNQIAPSWSVDPRLCAADSGTLKDAIAARRVGISDPARQRQNRQCIYRAAIDRLGLEAFRFQQGASSPVTVRKVRSNGALEVDDRIYRVVAVERTAQGARRVGDQDIGTEDDLIEVLGEHAFEPDLTWRFMYFRGEDTDSVKVEIR